VAQVDRRKDSGLHKLAYKRVFLKSYRFDSYPDCKKLKQKVMTKQEIEVEKIKAKIEAVNHFCKLNGLAGTEKHKAVIMFYELQLKKLEDESKID